MADILTMQDLANGHLDVKALGEAANGDENTIVTTRTGNTYPSAKRAIKTLFENGGLPAKPFPTLAEMNTEGASLADGQLAMVHNDIDNNGLYVKESGTWVKSGYDPLGVANKHTDSEIAALASKPKNLFNGNYRDVILYEATRTTVRVQDNFASSHGKTAYVEVEPNTAYTISMHGVFDKFRVALTNKYPKDGATLRSLTFGDNEGKKDFLFTTGNEDRYVLVYVSNTNLKPKMQIERGVKSTSLELVTEINSSRMDKLDLRTEPSVNLYKKDVLKGSISSNKLGTITLVDNSYDDVAKRTNKGGYSVIDVVGGQSYAIKMHSAVIADTPFNVTFWNTLPSKTAGNSGELVFTSSNFKEVVVTAPADAKFMLIQSPFLEYEHRLQIEKGSKFSQYKNNLVIPSYQLALDDVATQGGDNSNNAKRPFVFNTNLHQIYRRGRALDGGFSVPTFVPIDEIYSKYDEIVDAMPVGFFTKKSLGLDDFGNTLYEYETNPAVLYKVNSGQEWKPDAPDTLPIAQPTLYLTSGVHGNERSAVYGLLYAISDIILNPTNIPLLDYICRRVKLVIIPIVSPSAYTLGTRRNGNIVDVNRDMPPGGKALEKESKLFTQSLSAHAVLGVDYYLDFHMATSGDDNKLGYVLTDDDELAAYIMDSYQELGRQMQKEHTGMSQNPFHGWVYRGKTSFGTGTTRSYALDFLGIRSATIESGYSIKGISAVNHHEENVILYSEVVINSIVNCMKCLQRN